jgi:S1-C subfamily serine protease
MLSAERDHLSHLINRIADSEEERNELRRVALLQDVNRHEVLSEVGRLSENDRQNLFDRCAVLMTSDRKLGRRELSFLAKLRKACGVSRRTYQQVVWRATWRSRALALAALGLVAVAAGLIGFRQQPDPGVPPPELPVFYEISLVAAEPDRALLDPSELFDLVRSSVVTVNVVSGGMETGNGSGAVIGWDEFGQLYILTNRHVVYHELPEDQELCFEAELESGIQLPAALDFYSRRHDLALLVVPGLSGWADPLSLLLRDQLRVGQQVYAVGSPMGLDHTFTSGVISALRADSIQTDATVYFGSSGGPLVDASGALCGIITSTHSHKDISFAIYADAILELLVERRTAKTAE